MPSKATGFKKGIRKVKEGRQYEVKVYWREGRERKSKSEMVYGTYTRAQQRLVELKHALGQGKRIKAEKLTVGEYLTIFLRNANVRETTRKSIKRHFDAYVRPRFESWNLGDLTTLDIRKLYSDMREGVLREHPLSDNTIRLTHRYFRKALAAAISDGLLPSNPTDGIALSAPTPARASRWLSEKELACFLEASKSSRWGSLFEVLALTGMRIGEAVGLKWEDVDLQRREITVQRSATKIDGIWREERPKNGKTRTITIPQRLVDSLRTLKEDANCEFVFHNKTGSPADKRSIQRALKLVLEKVTLPDISLHDLRHSHASILLKNGSHIKVVSERLGHANVEITLRYYAHVDASLQRAAADVWDTIFAPIEPMEHDEKMAA